MSLPGRSRRSPKLKPYLLLDFVQYPNCTEQELRDALYLSSPQKSQSLNAPIKKLVIEVGLSGLKRRQTWKTKDGIRKPFVDLRRAYDKKTFSQKRSSGHWRGIYVDPKQSLDEIQLHLLLYLRQEEMVDVSEDKNLRALFRKCFKISDRYEKGQMVESTDSTAFLVLDGLLKNFTFPEDWRAMGKYVWTTIRSLRHKEASFLEKTIPEKEMVLEGKDPRKMEDVKEDPEEAQASLYSESIWDRPYRRKQRKETGVEGALYTVSEAADLLQSEGIPVSLDRIHDWINGGKIKCRYDRRFLRIPKRYRRVRCVDDDGLEALKAQLTSQRQQQNLREVLMQCLVKRAGKEKETARKFIYRHRLKGESLEEIARQAATPTKISLSK